MFSRLHPEFLYTNISSDITENDLDVVADTWMMDGQEVYRGTRDPSYDHADVYWLYNDSLERVGCAEHSLEDHADMQVLWFHDSEFGTLLQEPGWTEEDELWSKLPRHVFDRYVNEEWTTPERFLEHCLNGPVRIVTPSMLVLRPIIYTCTECGRKSLRQLHDCKSVPQYLDFPDKEKIFFVDFDFKLHHPPADSSVWSRLQRHDDDSSQEPKEQPVVEETTPVLQEEPMESQHTQLSPPVVLPPLPAPLEELQP